MAITDRTSSQLPSATNRVNAGEGDGYMKAAQGYVANAADDDATSIHRFCRIPTNAILKSVKLTTGDATTAGAINVGFYYPADKNDGAVIDADFIATAFALTGGPFINAELIDGAQYTVAEMVMPLWEALGLAADPGGYFDLAATISTTYNGAAVGQTISAEYSI